MATQVGEATIKLSFDGKTLNASLANAEKEVESGGKKSGSKWANAWSVAAGNLISSGINKVTSAISNNVDNAIARVDTLNNFPKVMRNIGISGDEAEKAISKMADKLQGIPTNLDTAAAAVQRFTSKNSDVTKSTDIFLALNNAMLAGGMSTEMQATALEQISQAYAKGKPDMMEWRSLLQAMPAQARQLAIAMGFGSDGIEDLGEALRKGDVTMDDFMNTVIQLNEQGIEGFDNFETQAKNATGGIQSAISIMNSRITQGISAVIDEVGSENITELAIDIGNAFKSVGKTLASVVIFVKDNWAVIGPIIAILGTVAGTIWAVNTAMTAWKAMTTAFTAVQAAFNVVMNANPIFLLATVIGVVITALALFLTQTETGKQILADFGQFVHDVFAGIAEFIKSAFQAVWDFVTSMFNKLTSFFGGVYERIKGIFVNIGQKVGASIQGIVKGAVNGVLKTAENILNGPIRAINSIIGVLNEIPGVDIGSLAEISLPRMAKGGLVDGATGAIIGEAGAEAVIPLERNSENWARPLATALAEQFQEQGEGRSITINVNNPTVRDDDDIRKITQGISQLMRRTA